MHLAHCNGHIVFFVCNIVLDLNQKDLEQMELNECLSSNTSFGQKPPVMTEMGYYFYSPNKNDCAHQEALECQAMIMEPYIWNKL